MRAWPVLIVTSLANLGFASVYAGLGSAAEGPAGFLAAFAASLLLPAVALIIAKRARVSFDGNEETDRGHHDEQRRPSKELDGNRLG